MFVDAQTQVSAAQSFTDGTAVSTNSIDLTAIDPDIAVGEPMGFGINIDVGAGVASAETYQFNIVGDDAAALSSVVVLAEMIMPKAELGLGQKFIFPLPPNRITERYIGLQLVLADGGGTATLTISAHLAPMSMLEVNYRSYPKGYVIS